MKNISFSNPYWLLALIPAALLLLIPFFLAIRKESRSASPVLSLVLHLAIVSLLALSAAGMMTTTVMTETDIYFVADVSYSANRNLDKIDAYIQSVSQNLPENSKTGLVCFGKNQILVSPLGTPLESVKDSDVDDSATNIADALEYTATLFDNDAIKRIVLITDGKETDPDSTSRLISSIENLYAQKVYVDAIYLDDNLSPEDKEVQVTGVDFTESIYLNHEATADVLIQSSYPSNTLVALYRNGVKQEEKAVMMTVGYNVVNFELDSSQSGDFDYEIRIEAEEDLSSYNNAYAFTQTVHGNLKVLLVTTRESDKEAAERLYGQEANIVSYVNDPQVPFTVEELCQFDEILLSNVDVRDLNNFTAFIDSLDKVVSLFGKSLVTIGDTRIQNKTDDVLKQLEDMLPVKFGNSDQDPKLYGIVIDTSRSMQNASRLQMAKQAAIQLLNLLDDHDYVTVISFYADVEIIQTPIEASNREAIAQMIDAIQPTQGTVLGAGLKAAMELMADQPFQQKQVMLISDGRSYTNEKDDPETIALEMRRNGIVTSVINTGYADSDASLRRIAATGEGAYYFLERLEDLEELILTQVADDVTETVLEGRFEVDIQRQNDPVLEGVSSLTYLNGYVYAKAKPSATTVLSVDFTTTGGNEKEAPVYAYWNYGNGRVASYTSTISGEWVGGFSDESGQKLFKNFLKTNTPDEKIDYPYTVNVSYDGMNSTLEILPETLNPYATMSATITFPNGETLSETLLFDSTRYYYSFHTPELGKYEIALSYQYEDKEFSAKTFFHLSYSPEYDSFVTFDASNLYEVVRNRGVVSEDGQLTVENDEADVSTYTVDFTAALLIAAVALYVIDIMIRKLKWNDIKGLFRKIA